MVTPFGYGAVSARESLRVPTIEIAPGAVQLSVAVAGVIVTVVEQSPVLSSLVFAEMLARQVITGGSLSFTVTVKLQVAALPWISVTVTSTVVVPTRKTCGEVIGVAAIL